MLQVSDLHRQARSRLAEASENPKKLALIHTAIALGSSLLLTAITYLLNGLIADTGGLDGMQTRSLLTTAQSILDVAITMAFPFWQMGIFYAALQWIKGEQTTFGTLLQGFRKLGAVLKLLFLQFGLLLLLGFAVSNISTIIFMLTPFSDSFIEHFEPIAKQEMTQEQLEALLTPEFTEKLTQTFMPLLIILAVLYAAGTLILFIRLRFAGFAVLEDLPAGKAFFKSYTITRKNFWQILKLDLSFWWFYLLQLLSVVVFQLGAILPLLNISLPLPDTAVALIFSILGAAFQCILLWQCEAKRVTVYGLAYHTLDGTIGAAIDNTEV